MSTTNVCQCSYKRILSLLAVFSNKYTNLRTSHAFYHVLSRSRDNPDFVSGFIFKARLNDWWGGEHAAGGASFYKTLTDRKITNNHRMSDKKMNRIRK